MIKSEYIYALISVFLWSTLATVTKLLLGSIESMQILFVSAVFAFLFLLISTGIKGKLKELKKYKLKDYVIISLIGALGIFIYHLFLYTGVDLLLASQAFIINYLWPAMAVLFAVIILKEKLTFSKALAILLSFFGVYIVTSGGNTQGVGSINITGVILCVAAAVSYGLFTVLNKLKNYDKEISMMLYYFVASLICFIYIIITKKYFVINFTEISGLIWIGVFTNAIAFTTWALALEKGDTAKISNLAYITPFLSLIWSYFILDEKLNIYSLAGLLLIVSGIFIQLKRKN